MPRIADSATRDELQKHRRLIRKLDDKLSQAAVASSVVSATGGVRTGTPAERGSAEQRHPEIFLQVDLTGGTFKVFATARSTTAGAYDWLELRSHTLT